MATFTTPNMGMVLPVVSSEIGPAYASEINTAIGTVLDSHTHTSGSGVPITPAAININTDLPFVNNNATGVRSVRFTAQSAPIVGSASVDVGCVYVSGVDLYYNDVSGNQVRMTQGGGVAGSPGSITGLAAPATATYVSVSNTFVWQSGANIAANLDGRNLILRNSGASSNGLTLSPPAAMASNYTLTLPTVPGSTSFVTLDGTGTIAAGPATANGITRSNLAAVGQVISSTCGTFTTTSTTDVDVTGLQVTITTTGRPVVLMLIPNSTSSELYAFQTVSAGQITIGFYVSIVRDGSTLNSQNIELGLNTGNAQRFGVPLTSISLFDPVAAGTYTYKIQVRSNVIGGTTVRVRDANLVAYEL